MALLVLGFLGGILTIISPCILPVPPFVFAWADQPFRKSGLPLLVGMALTSRQQQPQAAHGSSGPINTDESLGWPGLAFSDSR
jgi:hypothetical protein